MIIKYDDASPIAEADAIERDCRTDVCVVIGSNLYRMDVCGIDRLHAEVEADILENGYYNIYPGLVIVKEVSCSNIERTLSALYKSSYFDGLAPDEYLAWYTEKDIPLLMRNLAESGKLRNADEVAMFESSAYWLSRFRQEQGFCCMLQCLYDNSGNNDVMNYLFRAILSMSSCDFFITNILSHTAQIWDNSREYVRRLYRYIVSVDSIRANFAHELMMVENGCRATIREILSQLVIAENNKSIKSKLKSLF